MSNETEDAGLKVVGVLSLIAGVFFLGWALLKSIGWME